MGRFIPPGSQPNLDKLLSQLPVEPPDAEGFSGLAGLSGAGIGSLGSAASAVPRKVLGYKIMDTHTGQYVSELYQDALSQRRRIRTRAEKLNQDYGAHRYVADIIWDTSTP